MIKPLMSPNESFETSSPEKEPLERVVDTYDICVLKHIPTALKVLEGGPAYQLCSPRCCFKTQFTHLPSHLATCSQKVITLATNRLANIEDALFEHGKMKERRVKRHLSKMGVPQSTTLWQRYGNEKIYYSRLKALPFRENFASVFLAIGGINLEPKYKKALPSIKGSVDPIQSSIKFDSNIESGNLLYVYRADSNAEVYDLVLQNDINTKGHNQWFLFKVTAPRRDTRVRFNIVNMIKEESLFSCGLKPLVFSEKEHARTGMGWVRSGTKVIYEQTALRRDHCDKPYYALSFEYEFREANDTVYFAPSYPYTYSQLVTFLNSMVKDPRYKRILTIRKICESVGRNSINLVSISTGRKIASECKVVWIIARQHPTETTGSYMVQGIVKYLCEKMRNEDEGTFYDDYLFRIVPMLNADGVIHGNSRADLTGVDPNRAWKKPSKTVTPVPSQIKKMLASTKDQVSMVLDLHSHSSRTGCFFYGNNVLHNPASSKVFPSLVCDNDPRFTFKNSRFRGGSEASARRVLFDELGITNVYTVECSLLGYHKDNRIIEYAISDYFQMGVKLIDSYFHLEQEKVSRGTKIIEEQIYRNCEFYDVQSARSDSQISDSEYPEVYSFAKQKADKRQASLKNDIKLRSHTNVKRSQRVKLINYSKRESSNDISSFIRKNIDYQILEHEIVDRQNQETERQKIGVKIKKKSYLHAAVPRKQNVAVTQPFKMPKIKPINVTHCPLEERLNDSPHRKMKSERQQAIQTDVPPYREVPVKKRANQNKEKHLMVVGSSVDTDSVFVGDNDVGTQFEESKTEDKLSQIRINKIFGNIVNGSRNFLDSSKLETKTKCCLLFRS